MSQDLKTCTEKLVLSLEDDAPLAGPRAVFLVDIMNPCWILPGVDLEHGARLTAAVGQVPFNFQIGKDVEAIKLNPPATAAGELEVRVDGCDGRADRGACRSRRRLANDAVTRAAAGAAAGARRAPRSVLQVHPGARSIRCGRSTGCRCRR